MRSIVCRISLALLLADTAFSQPADGQPAFEAADVHVSARTPRPYMRGPIARNGRFEIRNANMVDLVRTAYGVDEDKVLGGPSWLEIDRFDIIAKLPAHSTAETRKTMLQKLLADRFKLVAHPDTQPLPAFALTAGKRLQLKKSDGSGETGCKSEFQPPIINVACKNMTMAAFAGGMREMDFGAASLNNNPVIDQTGLEGAWDFNFKFSVPRPRAALAPEGNDVITLANALEKLGLKLEAVKVPLPVIVVKSVNEAPSPNLPGVAESLKVTTKAEFEVADVKPSSPDAQGRRFNIETGGRVTMRNMPLTFLIQQAWNVNGDMLVGAPKWLDSDGFDIVAKASTGPAEPGADSEIDEDTIWAMFRNLLAERFKLAVHQEERPVEAYTLLAGKPKMKKADPQSRSKCIDGPAPGAKDPRTANPSLGRLMTCQNLTMAQFADKLQSIAPGYIRVPVLDATGLEGGWDFTLNFSAAGLVRGGRGGGRGVPAVAGARTPDRDSASGGMPGPSDDMTLSLPEAVERQLGVKLELQKRPVSVLVIDHIEQRPTDN